MTSVLSNVDGHVGVITLNRPDARNAYTVDMMAALVETLDRFERDGDVHVVLLKGNGKSFCAGGDVKALHERTGMFAGDPATLRDNYRLGIQTMMRRWDAFEKPVIGCIHGAAIGAGLGLSSICDVRVVAEGTKFGATFVKLGIIPGDGSAYLLARAFGFSRAMELVLTGRIFDTEEAERIGFAHYVVPKEQVADRAMEVAQMMASYPPRAVQLAKTALVKSWNQDYATSAQFASAFQALAQVTPEHQEAVAELWSKLQEK